MKNNCINNNTNLETVILTDIAEIPKLCERSAMVIEGLDKDSIDKYMDYLKKIATVHRERVFVIRGKLMNLAYRLAGENMYPYHLHIVAIIPEDVQLDMDTVKIISQLGAKDLNHVVADYNRMEIRRLAKDGIPNYRGYVVNDIDFNCFRKDRSLEYLIKTKPGVTVSSLGLSLLQLEAVKTADEDIEKIYVEDKETLNQLYEDWALTIEKMPLWKLPIYMDFLESRTTVYRKRVCIITGSIMNKTYGLTGENAYPDDIYLVSVLGRDVAQGEMGIVVDRSVVGARFFNDIVDNNSRREKGNTEDDKLLKTLLMHNSKGIINPSI